MDVYQWLSPGQTNKLLPYYGILQAFESCLTIFMHGSPAPRVKSHYESTKESPGARDSKKGVRWPSSAARLKAWVSFAYAHGEPRVDK